MPPVVYTPPIVPSAGGSGKGGGGGAAGAPSVPFSVGLTVENKGTQNVDMPSIEVDITNAIPSELILPATTLAPSASEEGAELYMPYPDQPGTACNVTIQVLPPQTVLDWANQELGNRPGNIAPDAWNAILANFIASVGETDGSLNAALQADAIFLAQVGDPVTDQGDLLSFELEKAEDAAPMSTLTSVEDSSSSEPGLPLTFERSFQQPIGYRYQLGTLGYGWTSNWNIEATTDSQGNVYIQQGGLTSFYAYQSSTKTYQSTNGSNQEVLTHTNAAYTLTGSNGSITAFLPNGLVNYVQDANGNRITAGYTAGLLTSLTHSDGDTLTIAYNAQGLISQLTDPAGNVTTYEYDANDQLSSVTNAQGTYQYTYVNGQGIAQEHAMASITYPNGTHTYFSYDSQGRLIEQSQDNGANATTYAYLSPGGYTMTDATGATTTFLTNLEGQPAVIKDPLGNVTQVSYDAYGQSVLTTVPGGTASSEHYDAQGNLVSETDPLGNTTQFTIDPQTGEMDALENANGDTTSFAYTSQGETAQLTQPDGTASKYDYNAQGEVVESIDAEGRATSYKYNGQGRLILRTNPDSTTIAYGYDSNGNVTSIADASGTVLMTYDSANRLNQMTYPNGQFLKYTYNSSGQLARMVDQTGFTENYTYNSLGQLTQVADANGNLIVKYRYDMAGRLAGQVNGNGTYTTYTYNADGDLLSLVNFAPNGTVNSSFSYTYDALGHESSMTTAGGKTTYGYDADGQLVSVQLPSGELITYAYDAMGNRTVVSDNGATTSYTTNSTNEYTSVGGATYSYDASGNLQVTTGPGGTTTYTYDVENRLIEIQTPTDTWSYQYDALGNLASSTHNGQTTRYLFSAQGTLIGEYDSSGNLIANFTYGVGLTSQVTPSGAAYYYDFDSSGNTAGLSGAAGTYVDSYSYLPFGQVQQIAGMVSNPFQYNAKFGVIAAGNGLDLMGARFYSPSIGRFMSRDPLGLQGGRNYYTYASNNPVSFSDPSGNLTVAQLQALLSPAQWADVEALVASSIRNQIAVFGVQSTDTYTLYQNWGNSEYEVACLNGQISQAAIQEVVANGLADTGNIENAVIPDLANTLNDPQIAVNMAQVAAETVDAAESNPVAGAEVGAGIGGAAALLTAGDAGLVLVAEAIADVAPVIAGFGAVGAGLLLGGVAGYGIAKGLDAISPRIMIGLGAALNALTFGAIDYFAGIGTIGLKGTYRVAGPGDPNSIFGPGGFGPQGFIPSQTTLPYVISFDNEPTANAAPQVVTVTQQLDPSLDWSTFQLDDFDFGGQVYTIPPDLTSYSTVIDARSTVGVYVNVNADFDPLTGLLNWTFTSIDPTTFGVPVGNVEEGFLPPDVNPPDGEGFVAYVILPKANDPTGTLITAQGIVIFQAGLPGQSSLDTPTIFNTIDIGSPTSSVIARL